MPNHPQDMRGRRQFGPAPKEAVVKASDAEIDIAIFIIEASLVDAGLYWDVEPHKRSQLIRFRDKLKAARARMTAATEKKDPT